MALTLWDWVLVPLGLGILGVYHLWLIYTIVKHPRRTVIGLNAENRHQWVHCMMSDPLKNGTLAVQTIRNNLMATTQLATISITLSSVITALVSSLVSTSSTEMHLIGGYTIAYTATHIKFFSVLLCFLLAFFGNLQAIRYYAHVSFLVTTASSQNKPQKMAYVVRNLNKGNIFWSFGMRAFYFSFPLLLWIFGSIQMFVCCCVMTIVLYFLDTTTHFEEYGRESSEEEEEGNVTSDRNGLSGVDASKGTGASGNSTLRLPLLI